MPGRPFPPWQTHEGSYQRRFHWPHSFHFQFSRDTASGSSHLKTGQRTRGIISADLHSSGLLLQVTFLSCKACRPTIPITHRMLPASFLLHQLDLMVTKKYLYLFPKLFLSMVLVPVTLLTYTLCNPVKQRCRLFENLDERALEGFHPKWVTIQRCCSGRDDRQGTGGKNLTASYRNSALRLLRKVVLSSQVDLKSTASQH